ncbi:hypothetical protein [Pseudoalteromonas sp. T1lg10]|uniref:hypothetical protein n=1 Tax=Pseudoalteromonas sp. T1lg10 TaxID=2077093 RepID=UPI000CF616CA|nr:hypothetical protein [Pseudoalteromonas sp. T1lg10]
MSQPEEAQQVVFKMGMMLKMNTLKILSKNGTMPKMDKLKNPLKSLFKNGMMPKMNTLKIKLGSRTK